MVMYIPEVSQNVSQLEFKAPTVANYKPQQLENMGKAVAQSGSVVQGIVDEYNDNINTADVKSIFNQVSMQVRDLLDNADTGYLAKVGKNAIDSHEPTFKSVQRLIKDGIGRAKNEQQKYMLENALSSLELRSLSEVDAHKIKESRTYNLEETTNTLQIKSQESVDSFSKNKMDQAEASRIAAMIQVDEIARLNGWADKSNQKAVLVATTDNVITSNVVKTLIAQDRPQDAKNFLDGAITKGRITPDQQDDLVGLVSNAMIRDKSLRVSLELSGQTFKEKMSKLQEMLNQKEVTAEEYDATVTRFEHDEAIKKAEDAENEKEVVSSAVTYFVNNPLATLEDLSHDQPDLYNSVKTYGRLDDILSFTKNGRYVTDYSSVAEVLATSKETLAEMGATGIYNKYRSKMDDQTLEHYMSLADAYANELKGGGATQEYKNILTFSAKLEQEAKANNILPVSGSPSKLQAQNYNKFETEINSRLQAFQTSVKRDATEQELDSIIDTVITNKVKVGKWGRDIETIALLTTPEQLENVYVVTESGEEISLHDIPQEVQQAYSNMLEMNRIEATPQRIAEMYANNIPIKIDIQNKVKKPFPKLKE